ncbi:hypothetical protein ACFQU9_17555 [Actinomadura namibiensis]|uniref:hypothetical protein n=1 Tax=Actinomadura kijaniata TaxID=46161 RepID=UPI00362011F1
MRVRNRWPVSSFRSVTSTSPPHSSGCSPATMRAAPHSGAWASDVSSRAVRTPRVRHHSRVSRAGSARRPSASRCAVRRSIQALSSATRSGGSPFVADGAMTTASAAASASWSSSSAAKARAQSIPASSSCPVRRPARAPSPTSTTRRTGRRPARSAPSRANGCQSISWTRSRGEATAPGSSFSAANRSPVTSPTTCPLSSAISTSTVSSGEAGDRRECTTILAGGSPRNATASMWQDIHSLRASSGVTTTALMVSAPSMTWAQLAACSAGDGSIVIRASCSVSLRRSSVTSQSKA